jgi:uncharacterized membrane protein
MQKKIINIVAENSSPISLGNINSVNYESNTKSAISISITNEEYNQIITLKKATIMAEVDRNPIVLKVQSSEKIIAGIAVFTGILETQNNTIPCCVYVKQNSLIVFVLG